MSLPILTMPQHEQHYTLETETSDYQAVCTFFYKQLELCVSSKMKSLG